MSVNPTSLAKQLARIGMFAPLLVIVPSRVATAPAVSQSGARPWFGFSISCTDCRRTDTRDGERWSFSVAPVLLAIEAGSPAATAGLRAGDVLTHIDGLSLTSNEGVEHLAATRPGQRVRFTASRGSRSMEFALTTAVRVMPPVPPSTVSAPVARGADSGQPVRYSGPFGNTDVEVRGPENISVTFSERDCLMEVRAGGALVRMVLREGCR